jgi:hypothetical protein
MTKAADSSAALKSSAQTDWRKFRGDKQGKKILLTTDFSTNKL